MLLYELKHVSCVNFCFILLYNTHTTADCTPKISISRKPAVSPFAQEAKATVQGTRYGKAIKNNEKTSKKVDRIVNVLCKRRKEWPEQMKKFVRKWRE